MPKYIRPLLAAVLIACAGCAQISGVESQKQSNFELPPSNLLILEYVNKPDEDFLKPTLNRLAACGIHAESLTLLIMGNNIELSRETEKPIIQKRIAEMQPQNILEVVPARETFNYYGANKLSTDYMIALKNLNGDKSWVAKLSLHRRQEIISYFVNPSPSEAFADALTDRMVSDGVLTHCAPKQSQ